MEKNGIYVKPWELVLGVAYLCTFSAIDIAGINISDKILLCLIAGIVFLKFFGKGMKLLMGDCIWLVLWIFTGGISCIVSEYPKTGVLFTANYAMQVLLFVAFIIIFAKSELSFWRLLKFLYHISTFCAIIGILQYYFWNEITKFTSVLTDAVYDRLYDGRPRVASLFDNPNPFAMIMACSIVLGIIFWIYSGKWIYIIEDIIMFYGIICAGTRSAIIDIIFAGGLIFLFSFNKRYGISKKIRYFIIGAGGIGGILVVLVFGISRFELVLQGIAQNDLSKITNQRSDIWKVLFDNLTGHWFFGLGNGISEHLTGLYLGLIAGPHSLYVGLLGETGIIGLVVFLIFIIETYYIGSKKIKNCQEKLCFFVMFSVFLVAQILEAPLRGVYQFIFWFWLIASMPYSASLREKQERNLEIKK